MSFDDYRKWSNKACLGYVMLACDRLGYTDDQETKLLHAMLGAFDMKTIDEAEQIYLNS